MPTKKVATPKVPVVKPARRGSAKAKPIAGRRALVYTIDAQAFWTSDGEILNSLVALRDAFSTMSKSVFAHHVTAIKNDFATWIDEVLGDVECAKDLQSAKTAAAAKKVIVQHLKKYHV